MQPQDPGSTPGVSTKSESRNPERLQKDYMKLLKLVSISPWHIWRWMLSRNYRESRIGIFKNRSGVIPGRWGFYILGFEFGSRNPGNPVGVWLKSAGLWPW